MSDNFDTFLTIINQPLRVLSKFLEDIWPSLGCTSMSKETFEKFVQRILCSFKLGWWVQNFRPKKSDFQGSISHAIGDGGDFGIPMWYTGLVYSNIHRNRPDCRRLIFGVVRGSPQKLHPLGHWLLKVRDRAMQQPVAGGAGGFVYAPCIDYVYVQIIRIRKNTGTAPSDFMAPKYLCPSLGAIVHFLRRIKFYRN